MPSSLSTISGGGHACRWLSRGPCTNQRATAASSPPITHLVAHGDHSIVQDGSSPRKRGGFSEIPRSPILNIQTDLAMRR